MGKEIMNKLMDTGVLQIDLSAQPNGIYFVKVFVENNAYSKKIVIQ